MSQVSYGTITITDTTDIERIYTVYAKSANNTTVPSIAKESWSENVSTAPGTGNYIWQRTVVEKSGTGDKTYSDPVCLTGEEGTDATEISGIEVRYGISADWNTQPTSWSADTPAYDSSKPKYWTRTRLIYDTNPVTYSDSVYTKDEALTKAVADAAIANSIAQHANEDAQGAMSQAASNVNSVTRLWYARATAPSTSNPAPTAPTTQITTEVAHDGWSITRPADDEAYPYYFYCDQKITGGGVISCGPVTLDTSTLSKYEIIATNVRTQNFFKGKDSSYDGWFASGRSSDNGLKENDAETYFYNARFGATDIALGYNKTPVIHLDGDNGTINVYRLPTINTTTHKVTTPGKLGAKLTASALNFYNASGTLTSSFGNSITLASNGATITIGSTSSGKYNTYIDAQGLYLRTGTTAYATLNGNGLILSKGGIESGNLTSGNGYVYLSTEDKTGITINGHAPGTNDPKWRAVIGSKFGVDSEGNLYANNAHLSSATVEGAITATQLTISSGGTTYSGVSAINANGYSIQIVEDKSAAYSGATMGDNNTYLYPILFLNGVKVETGIVYTNFIWYLDGATTGGTQGHSSNGGIVAEYSHTYRVTYSVDDTAVGEAQPSTYINVDPSKYITRIVDNGITIHPETMATNSNYIHIDGNSLMVKRQVGTTAAVNTDAILASFGTTAQIGQNGSSRFLMNSNSLQAYDDNNSLYFEVNSNGLTWGSGNTAATTTQVNTAAQTATNFIKTDGSGIKVQNSTDATNYVHIGSDGIQIYKNGNAIASFEDNITLGESTSIHNIITSTSFDFYKNQNTRIASIATEEETISGEGKYYLTKISTSGDDLQTNSGIKLQSSYGSYYSVLTLKNRKTSDANYADASLKTYATTSNGLHQSYLTMGYQSFILNNWSIISGHQLEVGLHGGHNISNSTSSLSIEIGSDQTAWTSIDMNTTSLGTVGNISFSCSHLYSDVALTVTSDKRLKQHKAFLAEDANKFIRQLKPARFIRNGEEHLGFYAQDVEEANEWNVELTPYIKDYKGLTYTEIIAPLVAYCQHLEKRINDLESQNRGGKE